MSLRRLWPVLEATLCLGGSASGETYYIAPNGNDLCDGSSTAPWATLQHAVEAIAPGDTIRVRSGTYAGCRIRHSGTRVAPKILAREAGATVVVNTPGPQNDHHSLIEIENGSGTEVTDWIVDGLEIANSPHHGIDIRISNRITIRNCYAHHSGQTPIGDGIFLAFSSHPLLENNEVAYNTEHGIYDSNSADYPTIRGNRSHHNSGSGIQLNADYSIKCPCGTTVRDGIISFAVVEGNVIYENGALRGGSAINADGVDDSVFRNNLLYNNHASGISLYAVDGSHGSSRNKVYNNTIVQAIDGRWCVNIPRSKGGRRSPVRNIVKNNILYTPQANMGSITVYSTVAGVLISDYNAVVDRFNTHGGASATSTFERWRACGYDTHSFVSSACALVVDAAANDYRLMIGSPAVDAGTDLFSAVVADIIGTPRPQRQGYDIGCYELPWGKSEEVPGKALTGKVQTRFHSR
jgi:parallel beta-helix repeat protein